MAKSSKDRSSKKIVQKEIAGQLATALSGLRNQIGEKKFNSRIKKAAKLLAEGVEKKVNKKMADEIAIKNDSKSHPTTANEGTAAPEKTKAVEKKAATKKTVTKRKPATKVKS